MLGSLDSTTLCGIDRRTFQGTYTAEGITKLCEGLKGSCVTSLRCAVAPKRSLLCQRPLTRLVSRRPDLSHACSLWSNNIGDKGAAALAAILKETQITHLECAAAR